jgi:hypothetical protein
MSDEDFLYTAGPVTPEMQAELDRYWRYRDIKNEHDRRRRERFRANGPVERYTVEEIGDRDGWVCGICKLPIDPELRRPDPRSRSIDHVLAGVHGGSDTRDNVRITHLDCNLKRNAHRPMTPEATVELMRLMVAREPSLATHPYVARILRGAPEGDCHG